MFLVNQAVETARSLFFRDKDRRATITARNFVMQMYLRNCALCALSRYGLMDDVYDPNECDPSTEYIEATHMSGAPTVLYPP